jgi:cation:H+ antiporter
MTMLIVKFICGLVTLYFGAEFFIKGASELARYFGISPFMIGLTIVGFGTSAPELAVNLSASFKGIYDIALGNIVGSNIANIGLILGVGAVICPLSVKMQLLRKEVPIMIGVALLLWGLCADGSIGGWDALIFLAGLIAMSVYIFRSARGEDHNIQAELSGQIRENINIGLAIVQTVGGMAGLVFGSDLMVKSAIHMAKIWGMSELIIGLTIVAVGTSLPELASTAIAAYRKQADIAVGNVIGSNIFNILLILGATASIHPVPVSGRMIRVEIPIMIVSTLCLLPIMRTGLKISRIEGAIFLTMYAGFIIWQVQMAIN